MTQIVKIRKMYPLRWSVRARVATINEHKEESPVCDLGRGSVPPSGLTHHHKHTSLNRDQAMRMLQREPQYWKINFQE